MSFDGLQTYAPVRIVLHGRLKKFGREREMAVATAAEAFRALALLVPGFRTVMQEGEYRVVRGSLKSGINLEPISLHLKLAPGSELHVIPQPKGAGGGGGKAMVGTVIMFAALAMSGVLTGGVTWAVGMAATATTLGGLATVTYGGVFLMGAAMFLGGVTQLLSPQPKTPSRVNANDDRSFLLSGLSNVTEQGNPVPLAYGRVRVGSVIASIGYSAEEYVTAQPTNPGSATLASAQKVGTFEAETVAALVVVEGGGGGQPGGLGGGSSGGGGAKGGGGGGGVAREDPNNLRSRAVVRIIDVLSEGPIEGLVDGAKSIYFNNTPLQAADGTWNFRGVSWELRTGLPDQTPVAGFPAAEQSQGVNLQVKKAAPVIQTITSATATAVRITVRIPALYKVDTTKGDMLAAPPLEYVIDVRPYGAGPYTRVVSELITGGKCVSPYERSYRFDLPTSGSNSWDIKVTRLTDDSASSSLNNDTWWSMIDYITDHHLIYPNTAYIAMTIDSEAFGGQLPQRSYEIKAIQCRVPMNYDPIARTYATTGPGTSAGTWDGASWKLAWTNNNAWVLYDIISSTRYGAGLSSAALSATKWDLYTIGQYCDVMVPDGFGGTEPRYSMNVVVVDQEDAYRLLQKFVGSFRGLVYWAGGSLQVAADMPGNAVKILSQANVIGGEFNYESSSLASRHNAARIAWRDPSNMWGSTVEMVEDYTGTFLAGQRVADVVAFGATSRGLSNRLGRWLIDTENRTPETVNFAVSIDNMDLRPGDIIKVADRYYSGMRMGGRLLAGSATTLLLLDDLFTPVGGETYTISVMLPDGSLLQDRAVSAWGTSGGLTTVTVSALSQAPAAGAPFLITSTALVPRQFRVAGIIEHQPAEFGVVALQHDPDKFSRVELGLTLPNPVFSTLQNSIIDPLPRIGERSYTVTTSGGSNTLTGVDTTGLEVGMLVAGAEPYPANTTIASINAGAGSVVLTAIRTGSGAYTGALKFHVIAVRGYLVGVGTTTINRTTVSWYQPTDSRIDHVDVRVYTTGDLFGLFTSVGASVDIDNLPPNKYAFGVRAVGRDGRTGEWVDCSGVVISGTSAAPSVVSGLVAIGGARRIQIAWVGVNTRDLKHYEVWRIVGGTAPAANPAGVAGAAFLRYAGANTTTDSDSGVLLPNTTAWYWVRAISTTDVPGPWAGPIGATTTLLLAADLADAVINAAKFASSIKPVLVIADTTVIGANGDYAVSTADGKLYKRVSGVWTNVVNTGDITGTISAAQIASLAATQITGQLTSIQIADLAAAKITGQLTDAQVAALAATKITGTLTAAQIASLAATQITGQLASTQITDLAVTAAKLAAGAVTLAKSGTGAGVNYIWNPCFGISTDGWVVGNATLNVAATVATTWSLNGQGSCTLVPTAATWAHNFYTELVWRPNGASNLGIPVIAGEKFWMQAMVIAKGGLQARFVGYWYDAANVVLASGALAMYSAGPVNSAATNGNSLSSYTLMSGITNAAPALATRLELRIRMSNESGITIDNVAAASQLVITRVGMGPMPNATATEIPPWAPGAATELPGGMVRAGTLTNTQIADLAAIKITGQLTSTQIADLAATKITGTLTSAQIADLAAIKITGTLTNTQIADLAVTGPKIAAGAITAAKITAGTITATELGAGSVTTTQLAAGAVTAAKITAGTITASEIAASTITGAKIAAGTIAAANIVAGTITATELGVNSVTTVQLAAGAVTAAKITAGTITATEIAASTITGAKIAAGTIAAANIVAGTITATEIAAGAITVSKLTMTGGSILPDTGFDDLAGFWAVDSAGFSVENNTGANVTATLGVRRAAVLWSPTYAGATQKAISSVSFGSCAAGQVYRLRARGLNSNTTRSVYVQIYAVNSANVRETAFPVGSLVWLNEGASDKELQYTVPVGGVRLIVSTLVVAGAAWAGSAAVGDITVVQAATGTMIVDGAITAGKIAANTITAGQIAADTITAAQIAVGAIGASEISANIIVAGHLASSTLITLSAQLGTAVVGTAQIATAAITSAKIGDLQVKTAQIDNLTVGTSKIAYNAATRVSEVHSFVSVASPGGSSPGAGQNACAEGTSIVVEVGGTVLVIIRAALRGSSGGVPLDPWAPDGAAGV